MQIHYSYYYSSNCVDYMPPILRQSIPPQPSQERIQRSENEKNETKPVKCSLSLKKKTGKVQYIEESNPNTATDPVCVTITQSSKQLGTSGVHVPPAPNSDNIKHIQQDTCIPEKCTSLYFIMC